MRYSFAQWIDICFVYGSLIAALVFNAAIVWTICS
jgi:hypothetical protein